MIREKIGEMAVKAGWITPIERDFILKIQQQQRMDGCTHEETLFGKLLYKRELMPENAVEELLQEQAIVAGMKFGRYKIYKKIAQGGMGIVYFATDPKLKREVALKIISRSLDCNETALKRFSQEAKVCAQIDSPNIVQVYEFSETPQPYYTMEYINGETLAQKRKQGNLDQREVAKILKDISRTLQKVHEKGVIHRDIKPDNIMVNDEGIPKVMDFGLAKLKPQGRVLSKTNDILGTPAYMSPEQAAAKEVDARIDIYSLGATLYELLTDRPPFQGESYHIIYQVLSQEPLAPRSLNPAISWELEAICLKCLEKNPDRRYQTARKLAKDLENYLHNKPITAKSPTLITYLRKWILRNKIVSGLIAIIAFVLIVGGGTSFVLWQWAENKTWEAEKQLAKMELMLGNQFLEKARAKTAKKYFKSAYKILERIPHSQVHYYKLQIDIGLWEAHYQNTMVYNIPMAHKGRIKCLAITPQQDLIVTGSEDRVLKLWDFRTGRFLHTFAGHEGAIHDLALIRNGKCLVSVSGDNTIRIWDVAQKRLQHVIKGHTAAVYCLAVIDDQYIVTGSMDQTIRKWNLTTGEQAMLYSGHTGTVSCLAVTKDGRHIISGSGDQTIRIWESKTGKSSIFHRCDGTVLNLAVSPDGAMLISGTHTTVTKLWNIQSKSELITVEQEREFPFCLGFSTNSKQVIIGGNTNALRILDIDVPVVRLNKSYEHSSAVHAFALSYNEKFLLTGCDDGSITLWCLANGGEQRSMRGHEKPVNNIVFSSDGYMAASGSDDNTVKLWSVATGLVLRTFYGHQRLIRSVAFSPDDTRILSGSFDHTLKLWDVRTGRCLHTYKGHQQRVRCVAFSPDGTKIASGSRGDGTIIIWKINGEKLCSFSHSKHATNSIKFLNKQMVLAGSDDGIKLWDIENRKLVQRFLDFRNDIETLAISPDGRHVVSSDNGILRKWDIETGTPIAFFPKTRQHIVGVWSLDYSHDGQLLISTGGKTDNSVKLWYMKKTPEKLENKELKKITNVFPAGILSSAFAPDSYVILLAGMGRNDILLYDFTRPARHRHLQAKLRKANQILQTATSIERKAKAWKIYFEWYVFLGLWDWAVQIAEKMEENGLFF